MLKVLILQRGSLSSEKFVISRSVHNRILEPIQYIEKTKKLKVEIDIQLPNDALNSNLNQYDIAIFCKHSCDTSVQLLNKLKNENVYIIHDIDDLIHKPYPGSIVDISNKKLMNLKLHLEKSDHIVFSNYHIQKICNEDFNIKKSCVIKTCFNIDKFHNKKYSPNKNSMMFTNGDNIKLEKFRAGFFQVFNDFLSENKELDFDIFGDSETYLKELNRYNFLGSLPWTEHKEYLMKNQSLFGVVPLSSKEEKKEHYGFTICKTPIKYYEYGSLSIPTIYSDSYIYTKVVENNVTGVIVENDKKSWKYALDEMIRNQEKRTTIARNAYEDIFYTHHIRFATYKWIELLQSFIF